MAGHLRRAQPGSLPVHRVCGRCPDEPRLEPGAGRAQGRQAQAQVSESGEPAEPALSRRDATAILLLAAGSAWGAGNIAPIVPDLASAFDLSLASVGLISGTLFFIGTIAGEAGGPKLAERIRVIRSLRLSAVLVGAGCLVLAAAPGFWALASGRVLAGLGLGVIAAVGPVFARTVGGIKGVGLFGGAFQGGIALGLGAGSVLADAGIDWRVGFLVSAAAGLSALTVLPADRRIELELTGGGFLAAAVRSAAVWRLALLFVAMFAAPLTIGAWLVHFLSVQGGMQLAVAGLLGFLLFAASGLFRFGGARLNDAGIPDAVLAGVMPLLASAGIVAIAFDQSLAVALPAVILIAAGFALPYAVMILAAQRLWPREPTEPVALMSLVGSAIPIAVIPVFGAALSDGNGDAAFVAMAIFIALAGFANVRLPRKPIPAAPGSGRLGQGPAATVGLDNAT
ncbi:MAG: MFS transporter [Acidobacteria bacterium]|nr:MAG: MFS transporter [Acidobacteriota bacterium]